MKTIAIILAVVFALTGCAFLEAVDMIFDDDCLYRGTVETVEHSETVGDTGTTVKFKDSTRTFTCSNGGWVDPGDWIEVRKNDNGDCFFDY